MKQDHVAVVTGSATTLGRAIARSLGRDHHLVLSDVTDAAVCSALDDLDRHGVSAEAVVADPADPSAIELLMKAAHAAGTVSAVAHLQQSAATDPAERLRDVVLGARILTDATLAVAQPGTRLLHVLPSVAGSRAVSAALRTATWTTDDSTIDARLVQLLAWWPPVHREAAAASLGAAHARWYVARRQGGFAALGARALVLDADEAAVLLATHATAA